MSYTPSQFPIGTIDELERSFEGLMDEYNDHLAAIEVEYSEKARQAYMTNPKEPWIQDGDKTREECLANQWDQLVAKAMASSARKKKRMEDARINCQVEIGFQAQHCFIHASEVNLYGFYKVTRHPTHYSFVLKRVMNDHGRANLGKETILPLHLDMSGPDWSNVTPAKIHTP